MQQSTENKTSSRRQLPKLLLGISQHERSTPSDMTIREQSIESILLSLDVKRNKVKKDLGKRNASYRTRLPPLIRGENRYGEAQFDMTTEIDRFQDSLTKRKKGGFCGVSRQESIMLQNCEGYRRLKEMRKDPRYHGTPVESPFAR